MKKSKAKLTLDRETIRILRNDLQKIEGKGDDTGFCTKAGQSLCLEVDGCSPVVE